VESGSATDRTGQPACITDTLTSMKLRQSQVWKLGDEYIRIVHLERLEVEYKTMQDLTSKIGTAHHVSKKEFCRLLKNAKLLSAAEIQGATAPKTVIP